MADPADEADNNIMGQIEKAIAASRSKTVEENDTGLCWGCHEPIEGTKRWHNAECRGYWEQDNRRKK